METSELHALLARAIPDAGGPGCAVGVMQPGQDPVVVTRGTAELEHSIPIDSRTTFHLASLSKQFTAYAIELLVADGLVRMQDRVIEHLSWIPFPDITIDHLIRHSSGLRDQWQLVEAAGRRMEDVISTEDVVALVRRQETLQFPPGTWHLYSNTNYTLLGLIVETVTDMTLDDFCRKRIFAPLGMTDTRFVGNHRTIVPRRAASYARTGTGFERIVLSYATAGATSLNSTVGDLLRWLAFSDLDGRRATPSTPEYAGPEMYGLGVRIGSRASKTTVWHAGADAGYRSHFVAIPELEIAVVVLSNLAELDPGAIVAAVLDLMLGPLDATITTSSCMDAVAGRYLDPKHHVVVDIADDGGVLSMETSVGQARLLPVSDCEFSDGYARIQLRGDDVMVSDDPAVKVYPWVRLEPFVSGPADEELVGTYVSDELDVHVRVSLVGETLHLERPHHPSSPLVPVADGVFHTKPAGSGEAPSVTLTLAATALTYSTWGAQNMSFERVER